MKGKCDGGKLCACRTYMPSLALLGLSASGFLALLVPVPIRNSFSSHTKISTWMSPLETRSTPSLHVHLSRVHVDHLTLPGHHEKVPVCRPRLATAC